MTVKRRRLPNFESCSVALFASLALGGSALPARAQPAAPTARSAPSPHPPARPAPRTLAPAGRPTPEVTPDGSISSPGFDEALK